MLYVGWAELFVEAYEACGLMSAALIGAASASVMALTQAYIL